MTTATTAPAAEHVEPPRDRYGRYLIPDPETGKQMPYTRATTFAKSVSDTFGLTKWMLRMGGLGLAQRQDLLLGIAAADPSDTKTLDSLMAEAKEHAGANSGATIGTALHSFTEQVDRGEWPTIPAPWDADVAAYVEAVAAAGLTILPEWIEKVVVIPSLKVAGTLDRIVRTADGRLVIADLKTGKDVSYAMGEIAVQLALYAAAAYTFDPATGELDAMPVVDQAEALVFHAPAGKGTCSVLSVDIAAGREMFETIEVVRQWRKRRDLHRPYATGGRVTTLPSVGTTATVATVYVKSGRAPEQIAEDVLRQAGNKCSTAGTFTDPAAVPVDGRAAKETWCLAAVTELVDAGHGEALAGNWPLGLPTFKESRERGFEMTETWLDMIHAVALKVAAQVAHPFFACGAYPDDDAFIPPTHERVTAVKARLEALPVDLVDIVQGQAAEADIPKLTSGKARRSQLDQIEGWVDEAEAEYQERRSMAAAHLGTLPEEVQRAALLLAGVADRTRLSAQACERLALLTDAHELGALTASGSDLVIAETGFADLLERHGGSKRSVVDAAKEAATLCGLARPTSSTQVANDVMLFAATYMANTQ